VTRSHELGWRPIGGEGAFQDERDRAVREAALAAHVPALLAGNEPRLSAPDMLLLARVLAAAGKTAHAARLARRALEDEPALEEPIHEAARVFTARLLLAAGSEGAAEAAAAAAAARVLVERELVRWAILDRRPEEAPRVRAILEAWSADPHLAPLLPGLRPDPAALLAEARRLAP
jgi:hypothetical protein